MKQHRPYRLEEYNSGWPEEFKKKEKLLRAILGDEIIDIYHIGSTAIPGMVAKPQIDILVVVRDLIRVKEYYDAMKTAGFISLGDYTGIGEECFAEDASDKRRLATIHIVPTGHPEINNQLNFRDYLKVNKKDRDFYISVKKGLYQKYPDNYPAYGSGKKEAILAILERANQWDKAGRKLS